MNLIGENINPVVPGRDQTIIGMFNVKRFSVRSVDRVGLEWRSRLQVADILSDHSLPESAVPANNAMLPREGPG